MCERWVFASVYDFYFRHTHCSEKLFYVILCSVGFIGFCFEIVLSRFAKKKTVKISRIDRNVIYFVVVVAPHYSSMAFSFDCAKLRLITKWTKPSICQKFTSPMKIFDKNQHLLPFRLLFCHPLPLSDDREILLFGRSIARSIWLYDRYFASLILLFDRSFARILLNFVFRFVCFPHFCTLDISIIWSLYAI